MYNLEELIARLGQPVDSGQLLGNGSEGWKPTPWGHLPLVPLGGGRYMLWNCASAASGITSLRADETTYCLAVEPADGTRAGKGWFVVNVCEMHVGMFDQTNFEELMPPQAVYDNPTLSPQLLIVRSRDYLERRGSDWEQIEAKLKANWIITLVQRDARFPDVTFVLMENDEFKYEG